MSELVRSNPPVDIVDMFLDPVMPTRARRHFGDRSRTCMPTIKISLILCMNGSPNQGKQTAVNV